MGKHRTSSDNVVLMVYARMSERSVGIFDVIRGNIGSSDSVPDGEITGIPE